MESEGVIYSITTLRQFIWIWSAAVNERLIELGQITELWFSIVLKILLYWPILNVLLYV